MFSLIAMPQGAEWLVILAIVILVFGAAKLPDLARGTGQALRIFKAETKGLRDDEDDDLVEDEDNRCGDVAREEVEHLLVQEDEREELTGFLTW